MGVPALAQLLTLTAGANALPNQTAGQTTPLAGVDFASLLAERLPAEAAIAVEDQAPSDPVELTPPPPENIGGWLLPSGLIPQASTPSRADPAPIGATTQQSTSEVAQWQTFRSQDSIAPEEPLVSARLQTPPYQPARPDNIDGGQLPAFRLTENQTPTSLPHSNSVSQTSANPSPSTESEAPLPIEQKPALTTDSSRPATQNNALASLAGTYTNNTPSSPKPQGEPPLSITRTTEQPRILPERGKLIDETNATRPAASRLNGQSSETASQPLAAQRRVIAPTAEQTTVPESSYQTTDRHTSSSTLQSSQANLQPIGGQATSIAPTTEQLIPSAHPNEKAVSQTSAAGPKTIQTKDQPPPPQQAKTAQTTEYLTPSALPNENTASQTTFRAPKPIQPDAPSIANQPIAAQQAAIALTTAQLAVPANPNKNIASETSARSAKSIETINRPLIEQTPAKPPATVSKQTSEPNTPVATVSMATSPTPVGPNKYPRELQGSLVAPLENPPGISQPSVDFATQPSTKQFKSTENSKKPAQDSTPPLKPATSSPWILAAPSPTSGETSVSTVKSGEGDQPPLAEQSPYSAPTAGQQSYIVPPLAPELNALPPETPASEYLRGTLESISTMNTPIAEKRGAEQLPAIFGKTTTGSIQTAVNQPENATSQPTSEAPTNAANIAGEPARNNENGAVFSAMPTPQTKASDAPLAAQMSVNTPLNDLQWSQSFGEKVIWLAKAELQSAQIQINPPQLGPVQISLNLSGDQASIAFSSPHGEVRQAIQDAIPQLRDMLSSAGINLGQANVGSQQPQGGADFAWQFANENRSARETAILPAENQAAQSTSGLMIQRGRGLVDLFA